MLSRAWPVELRDNTGLRRTVHIDLTEEEFRDFCHFDVNELDGMINFVVLTVKDQCRASIRRNWRVVFTQNHLKELLEHIFPWL